MARTWLEYQQRLLRNFPKRDEKGRRRGLRKTLRLVRAIFDDEWLDSQFELLNKKKMAHPLMIRFFNTGTISAGYFTRLGEQIEICDSLGVLKSMKTRMLKNSIAEFTSIQTEMYWIQRFYEAGYKNLLLEAPLPNDKRSDIMFQTDSTCIYIEIKTIVTNKKVIRDAQLSAMGDRILGEIKHHCEVKAKLDRPPKRKDFARLKEFVEEINEYGIPYDICEKGWDIRVDPLLSGGPETMTVRFDFIDDKIADTVLRQFRAAQKKFPEDMESPSVIILNPATLQFNILDGRLEQDILEEMKPQVSGVVLMESRSPLGSGDVTIPLICLWIPNKKARVTIPPIPTSKERNKLTSDEIEQLTEAVGVHIRLNISVDGRGRARYE